MKRFLGCVLILCLWMPAPAAFAGQLDTIKSGKKLVMLCYPHALSAFVKETSPGHYEGLDVYIMKAFANSIGVSLDVRPVPKFEDLIPQLLAGKGDVIASSFSITKEREKTVQFSEPYFPVLQMVVVRKESDIAKPEDLSGKTGSVVEGSSQEERMKQYKGAQVHYVGSSTEHYTAVNEKKADFAILDSTSVIANMDQFPNLKVAFQFPELEHYGFAVQPGSDVLPALDAFLKNIHDGGQLYSMIRHTLGDKGAEMLKMIEQPKP